MTSEDTAFGEDYLLFRVYGKIFACYGFNLEDYFVAKCDPDYALDLRDRHDEITPAWHWNKRYWNQISLHGNLSDDTIIIIRKTKCYALLKRSVAFSKTKRIPEHPFSKKFRPASPGSEG